jgi:nucleoside-diphosphate kinase
LDSQKCRRSLISGRARDWSLVCWPVGSSAFHPAVPELHRGVVTVAERTLVLVKPDAVRRGLVGEVLARFERKGFVIIAAELRTMDPETADQHYAEHVAKSWYPELREFITSGPILAAVLEGDQAVDVARLMVGATDGRVAAPGTIRGDFSLSNQMNLVHAADSAESAKREIALFFPDLTA